MEQFSGWKSCSIWILKVMTRIDGFTDYIGPSGGAKCEGYYHLYANKPILASGQDMYIDLPDGVRPKVNGSGIVMYDEVLPKARFFANLDVAQTVTLNYTSLTWAATLNDGFTFSDGDEKVYFNTVGTYYVQVYVTSDYSMGGAIQYMQLRYCDGFICSAVGIRQTPTVASAYNGSDVTYVVRVDSTDGTYIDVQAYILPQPQYPTTWLAGTKCGFTIVKV